VNADKGRWYLIMSKPNKDAYAEEQLVNQNYTVYRPLISKKKKVCGKIKEVKESLFPRYLFVSLKKGIDDWSSIRSTRGVLSIVRFGIDPAVVPDNLIQSLKQNETINAERAINLDRFKQGEAVIIEKDPFAGLEAIFQNYKSEERVIVLLNILNNVVKVDLPSTEVAKVI
jgi:transcriptional antiterminator RfaH